MQLCARSGIMSCAFAAVISASVFVTARVAAQQPSREYLVNRESSVSRTFRVAPGPNPTFDLRNVHGSIRVIGSDGDEVELAATKRMSADSDRDLAAAEQDVTLDADQSGSTLLVKVMELHSPVCGEKWNGGPTEWARRRYAVRYDFTVRVPRAMRLRLCTIDAGDVRVEGTSGEYDIDAVGGTITMEDIRGAGDAETVNGSVTVSFADVPSAHSLFRTINGDITVTLPRSLAADLRMRTFNGDLYTDFEGAMLPPGSETPALQPRIGKLGTRSAKHAMVRVGGGGPELTFDAFNGNVRVLGMPR